MANSGAKHGANNGNDRNNGNDDLTYFNLQSSDGISIQDRLMANMSREQIRAYRKQATQQALRGRYASTQNKQQDELIQAIHDGKRLTEKNLQTLINQAKSSAGISSSELLDFTLGATKKNKAIRDKVLSPSVLQLYIQNVQKASKHFVGGITPTEVINQSRAVDIKRANEQIFLATIFKRKGNELYFLTNAGPNSKSDNHYVTVELLDFPTLVLGRKNLPTTREIKNVLEHGKIKFDCDCGRHTYWYRYIASVGKFNFGAYENRYPSTRNPQLTGVACKHVLRVMQTLTSGTTVEKIKQYVKQDLKKGDGKHHSQRLSREQITREAEFQADPRRAEHYRRKIIQKIQKQLKLVMKTFEPLPTGQQYQVMRQMQATGIRFSQEQQRAFEAYQRSQTPFRR